MLVRFVDALGRVLWQEERTSVYSYVACQHTYVQANSKRRATWRVVRIVDTKVVDAVVVPHDRRATRRFERRRAVT